MPREKHDNEGKINEIADDCCPLGNQFDAHPFIEILLAHTLLAGGSCQGIIRPMDSYSWQYS